ncbi:MAG: SpoIIE family protein phosphatase [Ignavibacteriales bacterium]|nr:SpoIIE family protein phosphatase [Ignavibacteriales bacterium]
MSLFDTDGAQRNLSALVDFGKFINSSLDLKSNLNNLLLTCFGKFHTTKGVIALFDDYGELKVKSFKGLTAEVIKQFPSINREDIENNKPVLTNFKEKYNLQFCQHIKSSQGTLGIIFLGDKLSKKEYTPDDKEFIDLIINIAATAIENSIIFEKLKTANRSLDSKVSMLSSLFELSKEFSGVLETQRVVKLLIYSIIGQLLISNYAVIVCEPNGMTILDSKFPQPLLSAILQNCNPAEIITPLRKEKLKEEYGELVNIGVELLIPMQIQRETKGLILLGKRINNIEYSESDSEYIYSIGSLAMISIENARLFKETLEKQKMEKDLEIARNIQKNLFPKSLPKLQNFEIQAVNVSSKQVGGDYYDVLRLDDNNILFAIADVSGKGVPASLLMANLQAFLKIIAKHGMELSDATGLINDLVSENTMGENFITFFWGILNDEAITLTYVNAGHNPPLLIRNGNISKFTKGGMILGILKTLKPYAMETISLQSGDAIILFTDGVTEAMNKMMEEFTDERLEKLSKQIYQEEAAKILLEIRNDVQTHTEGAIQSDDITLMIIKVK